MIPFAFLLLSEASPWSPKLWRSPGYMSTPLFHFIFLPQLTLGSICHKLLSNFPPITPHRTVLGLHQCFQSQLLITCQPLQFFGLFNIPAFDSLPVSCKGETINWFPKAGGAERLMTGGQASVVGGVVGTY